MEYLIETEAGIDYPLTRQEAEKRANISIGKRTNTDALAARGVYRVFHEQRDAPAASYAHAKTPVKENGSYTLAARDLTAEESDALKAGLIAETKAEANRRILAILPEWKQRNYTARAVEKVAAGEVGDDEWNAMSAAWTAIKAVRVASDAIEAEIATLTDEQAGQYDVAASPLWDQ